MVRNKPLCVGEGVASKWPLEKRPFEAPVSGSRWMPWVWARPAPVHRPLGAGHLLCSQCSASNSVQGAGGSQSTGDMWVIYKEKLVSLNIKAGHTAMI